MVLCLLTGIIICYYGQMHKTGVKPEMKIYKYIITSLHYQAILPLEELK